MLILSLALTAFSAFPAQAKDEIDEAKISAQAVCSARRQAVQSEFAENFPSCFKLMSPAARPECKLHYDDLRARLQQVQASEPCRKAR